MHPALLIAADVNNIRVVRKLQFLNNFLIKIAKYAFFIVMCKIIAHKRTIIKVKMEK